MKKRFFVATREYTRALVGAFDDNIRMYKGVLHAPFVVFVKNADFD